MFPSRTQAVLRQPTLDVLGKRKNGTLRIVPIRGFNSNVAVANQAMQP